MRAVLILFLTLATPLAAGETVALPNYAATYSATVNGLPIDVTRRLARTEQGYAVTVIAKNWLGNIQETENFHINGKGQLLVDSYTSQRRFFGISRKENLEVDRSRGLALYDAKNKHQKIPVAGNFFGPLSYQLQMSRDLAAARTEFCYRVLMRGKLKDYCYEPAGERVVDTPLGKITTVQMRRLREHQDRETLLWLAPQWDYLLVKLWQKEDDGETHEFVLSGARVAGKSLQAYYPATKKAAVAR